MLEEQCSARCWTPVDCKTCGLQKAPIGRSVPLEVGASLCNSDCRYHQDPRPPHLWWSERRGAEGKT